MARARNIKPGFFKNEDLAECSPWARLCFAGLWTLADREGRLEDRPKRIKGELFAFDSVEVEPLLVELEAHGFLVRYRNSDGSFIQISKFSTHQTPHYSEKPSVIKPPELQESKAHDDGAALGGLQENSRSKAVIKRGSQPSDSLIPDSPNPEEEPPTEVVGKPSASRPPDCPTQILIDLYHEHLPMLPRVEVINDTRKRALSARWREVVTDADIRKSPDVRTAGIEWFAWFFSHCAKSRFLIGKAKDWRADFDFLLTPSKFARAVEGAYHKETA